MTNREILLALAIKHKGDWNKIYTSLQKKDYDFTQEEENLAQNYAGNYITILDSEYPDYLKQGFKPPFVLFYKGDISLIDKHHTRVCISTSNRSDEHALSFLKDMLDNNTDNVYVVGKNHHINIDRKKHKVIFVSSAGLDMATDAFYDLIVSEYPDGTYPDNNTCYARTRIMSTLSSKLVVGLIKRTSGTRMLITHMLQQGGEIFVMPLNPWTCEEQDLVNNELIYEGACPLVNKWQLEG